MLQAATVKRRRSWKKHLPLHLMLVPGILLLIMFHYIPMAGIVIAFQNFIPAKGFFDSKWVGWNNFEFMLQMPGIGQVLWNTIFIAFLKIIFGQIAPIVTALLLNEVRKSSIKRSVQTLIYLPHFLSWVILGGILIDILSPSQGLLNEVISWFGMEPLFFLAMISCFLMCSLSRMYGRNLDLARLFISLRLQALILHYTKPPLWMGQADGNKRFM